MSELDRPMVFVVGCGKCGTTTLAAHLGRHPRIAHCVPKEPNFFSRDDVFARGIDWYRGLFPAAGRVAWLADSSVSYSLEEFEDRVVERIADAAPEPRFVYIAREPFARLESVYREHHDNGHRNGWYLPWSIGEALHYRPAMLANSLYWRRTEPFRSRFGDQSVLYLTLEDLRDDPDAVLDRVAAFLGVEPFPAAPRVALNPGGTKRYDTPLRRWIRRTPPLRAAYDRLPGAIRTRLEARLRPRFEGPIRWEPDARERVARAVAPDVAAFLAACGKPLDFWERSRAGASR